MSAKAKLPRFKPAFTEDQVSRHEADYNDSWGEKRRLVMLTLARTPAQLAEGFKDIDAENFTSLLGCFEDYKNHCKAGMELAEAAAARMIAIGQYITDMQEAKEGAKPCPD